MDAEELLQKYAAGQRQFHSVNLRGIDLQGVNLSEIDFYNADLTGADLNDANLSKANLRGTKLVRASFTNANLSELKDCHSLNLSWADLSGADLSQANLDGANLKRADLTGVNIYGATFTNADLTGAIMPDGEVYQTPTDLEFGKPETPLTKEPKDINIMTRKVIRTDKAPAPVGPYNQAILASGQMLFVAGQIAIDPHLGDVVYTEDVVKQTEQVMRNIEAILTEAGATFADVVKTGVFLADMNDFAAVNAVYAKYFSEDTAPARACVEVSRLPKNVLVEIDCIAVIAS